MKIITLTIAVIEDSDITKNAREYIAYNDLTIGDLVPGTVIPEADLIFWAYRKNQNWFKKMIVKGIEKFSNNYALHLRQLQKQK